MTKQQIDEGFIKHCDNKLWKGEPAISFDTALNALHSALIEQLEELDSKLNDMRNPLYKVMNQDFVNGYNQGLNDVSYHLQQKIKELKENG